ncbi:MAG: phosphate acyltransferase PlsX [Nitrospinae bacterium]|nr:phosphate acyltransferase PlsX [Nitrospinota bacterium]
MKIAVDAMGGDYAPGAIVEGAVQAAKELTDSRVVLVGMEDVVKAELNRLGASGLPIDVVHASEAVGMDESPAVAFRKKKDSSIMVGVDLLKNGQADAFVSAGNTGAVMAASLLKLRTIPGISRAPIAVMLPTSKGWSVLLDAGANVDCKPANLFEFGIMGSIYASFILGKENPVVATLSIGEEEGKGNDVVREAAAMLKKSASLNFTGNIEAKEVYRGNADVIVCDGFVGNITLKVSESLAEMMEKALRGVFMTNWRSKLAYLLVKPYFEGFKKRVDHSEYGGAPLLGVNGTVIISHGSSKPKSIKNAIFQAERCAKMDIIGKIRQSMEKNAAIEGEFERSPAASGAE